MNREETLTLWRQGKDAWNAWAEKMLAEKKAMEEAGTWAVGAKKSGAVEARNKPTHAWLERASADFSSQSDPFCFDADVDFAEWKFPGDVCFDFAQFNQHVWFTSAKFFGAVTFRNALFRQKAWLDEMSVLGLSSFTDTNFLDLCSLSNASLAEATFGGATFSGLAMLSNTSISGDCYFNGAKFLLIALFDEAEIRGRGRFVNVVFADRAVFDGANFCGATSFEEATFNDAGFDACAFRAATDFARATFKIATFDGASFSDECSFHAIDAQRAFSVARASFLSVPDFIQAHFAEPPRLDHIAVVSVQGKSVPRPRKEALVHRESASARWRALRRLAIQGHDHERELQFFAGEMKAARFVTDYPYPWPIWKGAAWSSVARYWMGLAYQLTSNFGRSIGRPLLLWSLTIVVASGYFLSQTPNVAGHQRPGIRGLVNVTLSAWLKDEPCYVYEATKEEKEAGQFVSGLAPGVRAQTSASTEALHLALRNAFIVLDGGSDAAHRTYGCLYGVERYNDNPVAVVPSNVSFASALQKLVSGIMIFLFGLGVRNMLRMK